MSKLEFKKNKNNKLQRNRVKTLDEIIPIWRKAIAYWLWYPDKFIDFISGENTIKLYFYQRAYLRFIFRTRKIYITATRGTGKTFIEILALFLLCIFRPNTNLFICTPIIRQGVNVAEGALHKIYQFFPLLKSEVSKDDSNKEQIKITFLNGSILEVIAPQERFRGIRKNGGCTEEVASDDYRAEDLSEIVVPMMANNRVSRYKGQVNPYEIHKRQIFVTTAGRRGTYGHTQLMDIVEEFKRGRSAMIIGNDYKLPCYHGLLDINYIHDQKNSTVFNPLGFQREYESVWTGSSEKSLIELQKLRKTRVIKVSELKRESLDWEYVLAYDVARSEKKNRAESALIVFKIKQLSDGSYKIHVVNVVGVDGTHSSIQARYLKEMVSLYGAKMLIVDCNGLGTGVIVDKLILDEIDENPTYSVVNDSNYDKYKKSDSLPILYNINASHIDEDINKTFIAYMQEKRVKFLSMESEVKEELMKKAKGNPMDYEQMALPFAYTDMLQDEIMNLEYITTEKGFKIKRINSAVNKDKFSALKYGLYWIYNKEQENKLKLQRKTQSLSSLCFFG